MGPHTCTHPCTPAHRTPAGTCAYPHTPVHTHAHLLTPVQIRVNRKMAEDRKIEKGRKEQESAEAIRIIKPRGPKKFWRGLG